MSAPEPRDLALITPESIVRLIEIKPSIKEFFVRAWNKVLFAVERMDDFSQHAHSAPGWLTVPEATPQDVAFEMRKKCGVQRYYVMTIGAEKLVCVGCFFDLLLQNALSSYLPMTPVKWTDAARFIHEQDAKIGSQKGVTPLFFQQDVLAVTTAFGSIKVSWHALNNFCKRVGNSRFVETGQAEYDPVMKRNTLLLMLKLLRASQPVERENRVTQMLKHGCRPADYRSERGWIFVIADGALITCYEKGDLATSGCFSREKKTGSAKGGGWKTVQKGRWFRKKYWKEKEGKRE